MMDFTDLDFYKGVNCLQIPVSKLLEYGFATGHGFLRSPNSIGAYATLLCIVIQSNQNDCFGGQSVPEYEYALAPGVMKTYITEVCNYLEFLQVEESVRKDIKDKLYAYMELHNWDTVSSKERTEDFEDILTQTNVLKGSEYERLVKYATEHTEKATYQAMEALIHNLNTLASRAGNQVPFSSINFGTGTTYEQRLVIRMTLLATEAGLGDGETPIFPISIFRVKEGINYNPTDPNYDLFKLSCRVSAKRLFPNFIFLDSSFNLQYYKEDDPNSYVAVMGCSIGTGIVSYKFDYHNSDDNSLSSKELTTPIANIVDLLPKYLEWKSVNRRSKYIEFDKNDTKFQLYVKDSTSNNKYTRVKKFIHNTKVDTWYHVSFSNGAALTLTGDHPLPVNETGRTCAESLVVGNTVNDENGNPIPIINITKFDMIADSYDFETESDRFDLDHMCSYNCRTRVMGNIDKSYEKTAGRGNISMTTINLPMLALEAKGNIDVFFEKYDEAITLVRKELMDRYNYEKQNKCINFPFLMGQGLYKGSENFKPESSVEDAIKHGTLTFGFIGLAEALIILTGKHHGESEESQTLGLKIVKHLRDKADAYTKQYQLNFSVIGSPAEGTTGRFARILKKKYGIIPRVTDKDYLTNSSHVPVDYHISVYKKIQIEAPYHEYCNGGCIAYAELDGDLTKNIEAFESVVRAMKEANIGYGAINHPVDRDPVCGYVGIIHDTCPRCGRHDGEAVNLGKLRKIVGSYQKAPTYGDITSQQSTINDNTK